MEDYVDYLYVVVKMLHDKGKRGQVEAEQVSLIVGPNFVFSFQESGGDVFDPIRERIRSNKGGSERWGPIISRIASLMPLWITTLLSWKNWGEG